MIIQVCCCIAWVVAEWADERFLRAVNCNVVLECLGLVGLVFTMSAVKLENPCMSVLAVKHLVKPHVSITTLITPANMNILIVKLYSYHILRQSITSYTDLMF